MQSGLRRPIVLILAVASASMPSVASSTASPSRSEQCTPADPPDTVVYDTSQVAWRPKVRSAPQLRYPVELRQLGIEGTAVLGVTIDPRGHPEPRSITVLSATDPQFALAARDVLRRSRFVPLCRDGHAVRVRAAMRFTFRLTP